MTTENMTIDEQVAYLQKGTAEVINEEELRKKLEYTHKNPITRGLVDRAEQWQWSSYRYYELDDSSILKMDWDGVWPIVW